MPNSKKCVIKGDHRSGKGPTKNLYILIADVVLDPDDCLGRRFSKLVGIIWTVIGILCYFESEWDVSNFVKITQDVNGSP